MMNDVLSGYLDRFCTVYLDDKFIFLKSAEEHRRHVKQVLERLREHKLYASLKKCYFMTNAVESPGVIVSDKGLKVNPAKIQVIRKWPIPSSISEVRIFLGLASYFRRLIKGFNTIALSLKNLTKAGKSIKDWDKSCTEALERLKKSLISSPILCHPNFILPYKCHIDASLFDVGGTLTQVVNGSERVISYFSKK